MNNSEMSAETAADKSGADEVTTSSHSSANTFVVGSLSLSNNKIEYNAWHSGRNKYLTWKELKEQTSYTGRDALPIGMPITELNHDTLFWLEYTKLQDKDERKIFKGDILNFKRYNSRLELVDENVYVDWGVYCYCLYDKGGRYFNCLDRVIQGCITKVGNVFENAELLGSVK